MHRGVQDFVRWLEDHRKSPGIRLSPPARNEDLAGLEQTLGGHLPTDLRMVLMRFNGGSLPNGTLLPAGTGVGTIEAAVRSHAERVGADFLDPELLLPFHETVEGSTLAFDRSAGPVSDTWPVVDYFPATGEARLVYRTFDGWCRACLAEWQAEDFLEEFSLAKYLRQGERHVAVEPDVATAHATVAHALKRAGRPEEALTAYIRAARCVPPLPWCDWEALKIAALLMLTDSAHEPAARLSAPVPSERWRERGTTPGRVADAIGRVSRATAERSMWVRLLDMLEGQAPGADQVHIRAIRHAIATRSPMPAPLPSRGPVVPPDADLDRWWRSARQAYEQGALRDEDLLLDASLRPLEQRYALGDLLRIRRDF